MTLPGAPLRQLVHAATTDEARPRSEGADAVTEVIASIDTDDAVLLSALLVSLATSKEDANSREAQLNALHEIDTWHPVDHDRISRRPRS